MFEKDYTQLGIERNGEVVGIVSYRSISRVMTNLRKLDAEKNLPGRTVEIAIEELEPIVSPDDDLVVLFNLLAENPYALIRDADDGVLEIVTNYDLLHYLRDSIEPFLLIEDIEISIREVIVEGFSEDLSSELQSFFEDRHERTPESITDCSFGHYTPFMQENWSHFGEYFEENGDFVGTLINEVSEIRNDVFHFRAEPQNPNVDKEFLEFAHSYFAKLGI